MTLWSYKISRDFGFAPNPFFGHCTLATCKPRIRNNADVGELVIGCGSITLGLPERMIFAMKVTEKLSYDEYWSDMRFEKKRPGFHSSKARGYGDNIYHKNQNNEWIQEDSHHSYDNGVHNEINSERDLHSHQVLISDNFVYWGKDAPDVPAQFRTFLGDDLYPNARDFRNGYEPAFEAAVIEWFDGLAQKGRVGLPYCWK